MVKGVLLSLLHLVALLSRVNAQEAPICGLFQENPEPVSTTIHPSSGDSKCFCGYTFDGNTTSAYANQSQDTRIINGQEAPGNKYTWMAFMYGALTPTSGIMCGGSIISSRHVLLAAHCVDEIPTKSMLIIVGQHDLMEGSQRGPYGQMLPVMKKYPHEKYDSREVVNDIAVLLTGKKIEFNSAVGPVCMPNPALEVDGKHVTVLGWGVTEAGKHSTVLRETQSKVISTEDCRKYWPLITCNQQCIYNPKSAVCFGDSGGPTTVKTATGQHILTGVTSYVRYLPCDPDYPTVNTYVPKYVNWIKSKIDASQRFLTGDKAHICTVEFKT